MPSIPTESEREMSLNDLFDGYIKWNNRMESSTDPYEAESLIFLVHGNTKRKKWFLQVSYEEPRPKLVKIAGTKGFDSECAVAIANKMAAILFDWMQYLYFVQKDSEVYEEKYGSSDSDGDLDWDDL